MDNNFSGLDLAELEKMAQSANRTLNLQMAVFQKKTDEVIKNAPKEDLPILEKMKALTNKAIQLAKDGKQSEAEAVINDLHSLRNGS